MIRSVASISNADVGRAFNAVLKSIGRDDLSGILFNWNESQLNIEGDKIIGYPGRDGRFSLGEEGGRVNIRKRDFLAWLLSDNPFDEKNYGADIRNNLQWTGLIQQTREIIFNTI